MKPILLLFISLCITLMLQAQVSKTLEVIAGGLESALTANELKTITNLTLFGTIDAWDFYTMSYYMPYLAELDLSGVDIVKEPENSWLPANTFGGFGVGQLFGPENRLTSVKLPFSCTSIAEYSLANCKLLTSITIPSSVTSIGYSAFSYCHSLTSIFTHPNTPVDMTSSPGVFDGFDKNSCTLYVPFGTWNCYAGADQWKDFYNIIEIPFIEVFKTRLNLAASQGSTANSKIVSDVNWEASCDQSWLTLSQSSGTGEDTLIFTTEANPGTSPRTATVTISADGVDSQTITVTQEGWPTALDDLTVNSTQLKCYPNPFTDEIAIEIQNPKHTEISVDIYNLAGERIKNLATKTTYEQLDLKWNGTNDSGQKVVPGVYICTMNNHSKRLILLK